MQKMTVDFFGENISLTWNPEMDVPYTGAISHEAIQQFYQTISQKQYEPLIESLKSMRETKKLDDWLFFQLVRKTTQNFSPKQENYTRYTLYKWFLLAKTGYDVRLSIANNHILLYVYSPENIYEIPAHFRNGKQYVCMNFHDYPKLEIGRNLFELVNIDMPGSDRAFTYRITQVPVFNPADYVEKKLHFNYFENDYQYTIKLTPQIKTIFANYPVVDYEFQFNIPLSRETYASLIPAIQKNIKGMSQRNGIEYLMQFTRHAFIFERDTDQFGKEKRLTPEQTLLFDQSDCDDRAALFYFLVKEIYNLPMIVMVYPAHVTVGVSLAKPVGKTIHYKGLEYSVCEPTPQSRDLPIGELLPELKKTPFEIAFSYQPKK